MVMLDSFQVAFPTPSLESIERQQKNACMEDDKLANLCMYTWVLQTDLQIRPVDCLSYF